MRLLNYYIFIFDRLLVIAVIIPSLSLSLFFYLLFSPQGAPVQLKPVGVTTLSHK